MTATQQESGHQPENEMPAVDHWRDLAGSFLCILSLVRHRLLKPHFQPQDLELLCHHRARGTLQLEVRGVLEFLLHVWDHQLFKFELSTVAAWSESHQRSFTRWVTGETLGQPCRYF